MKWLITGGCGFIGRGVISRLLSEGGNQIRVLDNLITGARNDLADIAPLRELNQPEDWSAPLSLVVGDVRDSEMACRACAGADIVVHLAANTGVEPSVIDPRGDCETNVFGTLNLLEGCRLSGVKRFVFASTSALLGFQEPPLSENTPPRPASPYGASKLAGEGYCSAYFHSYSLETVALRFGNVYGTGSERQDGVIPRFIRAALAGEPLKVFGDGCQTRDFIHIQDLTDALVRAALEPKAAGETFQLASAREVSVLEVAEMISRALVREGIQPPKIQHTSIRTGDIQRFFSDTKKARKVLGWTPRIDIETGIQQTVVEFFV